MSYRIAEARLINVLGFAELELKAGRITRISGKNREGKTTIVRSIQAALGGGHHAELIRNGTDEAEIVLVIEDGTDPDNPIEVRKRIKRDGFDLKVSGKPAGIGDQTFLNALHDSFGINPIELWDDSKRADIVLGALDLKVEPERVLEAATDDERGRLVRLPEGAEDMGALELIDAVHRQIYKDRTEINRIVKDAVRRAEDLKKSLPEEAVDVDETKAVIAELVDEDEELERRIEQAQARRKQIAVHKQKLTDQLDAAGREANTREMLQREEDEAESNQAASEARTRALDRLDQLRTEVASDLPFGIEFTDDGDISVGGVVWETLNTEQKIDTAMKLATLRTGRLPVILIDGIERLDGDNQQLFMEWIEANAPDAQLFVTRVATGQSLNIETEA